MNETELRVVVVGRTEDGLPDLTAVMVQVREVGFDDGKISLTMRVSLRTL